MRRTTYYQGDGNSRWGIYNVKAKAFQFGIDEETPMLAEARLFQKIGDDARKYRFEPRVLPKCFKQKITVSAIAENDCEDCSLNTPCLGTMK